MDRFRIVQQVIRERRTSKILAPRLDDGGAASALPGSAQPHSQAPGSDLPRPDSSQAGPRAIDYERCYRLLDECVATAGWAPFHYQRQQDGIAEPWRFYILRNAACHDLSIRLPELIKLKPGNKLPQLLRGCHASVLVNWLPEQPAAERADTTVDSDRMQSVNEEHLAATAAATQNLLLLAQSLGWLSYWSSGGLLGSPQVQHVLGIPDYEKLIAAVFVRFDQGELPELEILSGKNRDRRAPLGHWCRAIEQLANP